MYATGGAPLTPNPMLAEHLNASVARGSGDADTGADGLGVAAITPRNLAGQRCELTAMRPVTTRTTASKDDSPAIQCLSRAVRWAGLLPGCSALSAAERPM